jgi:segregation and condensation protein B
VEQILEAMLFVGGPPLTPATAASAIRGLTEERFHQALHALNRRYRRQKRPYAIVPREDGFVLSLVPAYQHLRERLYGGPRTVRLSQAALDVLAIVAYRQPLTKAEVDALRGQESGPQLRQLLRLGLITMLHRGESLPPPETETPTTPPQAADSPQTEAPTAHSRTGEPPDARSPTSTPQGAAESAAPAPASPVTEALASPPPPPPLTQAVRYGTTPRFLRFFGLTSLDDLPRLATDT